MSVFIEEKEMELADFQLTAGERYYLVEGRIPDKWDIPWGSKSPTEERAKELDELYQCIDDMISIGLDNHGSTIYLAILKKKNSEDNRRFAFQYSFGGETLCYGCDWGDEALLAGKGSPVFVVKEKVITKTIYTHSNGKEFYK